MSAPDGHLAAAKDPVRTTHHAALPTFSAEAVTLRLHNGVRALLLARPGSPTLALQVLVRAGSRHDGPHPGLAHLVEHLVFRAPGPKRVDLFAAVEGLGGEIGASTGRDYTSLELVIAAEHGARALALLPALVRPPATTAAVVDGERRVIAHELRERVAPADALWDLLLAALWADDPLVGPPAGTAQGLASLSPEAAQAFHARYFRPPHLLVAAAGACDPAAFADAVEAGLGDLRPTAGAGPPAVPLAHPARRHATAPQPVTYLAVGVPVTGHEAPAGAALHLLEYALGRGRAARLARAVAARGLTVAVQARYAPYAGVGAFAALAAAPPSEADAVEALLGAELHRLGAEPPAIAELAAAQAHFLGALYRRCETNLGLANTAGVEALFVDEAPPLAGVMASLREPAAQAAAASARRYFARADLACARLDAAMAPSRHTRSSG